VKRLTKGALLIPVSLVWSPDGKEIWFTATAAGRNDFSVYAVSPSGSLREMLRTGYVPELQATFGDGRVLLSLGQFRMEVAGLAPGESVERNLSLRGRSQSGDLAEDGRRYVISDEVDSSGESAFVGHMDGTPLVRLGEGSPNSISPDGRSVLAWKNSAEGRRTGLAELPTGAGEPRDLPRGTVRSYLDARFLPDGRHLLLSASEQDKPRRLFVQDLPDGVPKPITPEGVFTEYAFTTPDGAWVPAGTDYEASPYLLYPINGGEPRPIPGLEKGDQPIRFSADGRRLFVRYGRQDLTKARIALLDLTTGRKQPWKVLSPADPAGVHFISHPYVTPDGRAYVYNYYRLLSDLFLVEGLK
jgi:Tol biopolymer transport system component